MYTRVCTYVCVGVSVCVSHLASVLLGRVLRSGVGWPTKASLKQRYSYESVQHKRLFPVLRRRTVALLPRCVFCWTIVHSNMLRGIYFNKVDLLSWQYALIYIYRCIYINICISIFINLCYFRGYFMVQFYVII